MSVVLGGTASARSTLDRRRRAVDAMGLGPLWLARTAKSPDEPVHVRAATIAAMGRDALVEAVTTCRACALCTSRTHAVFGEGAEQPRWLVLGTAPSREDDAEGAPLTGPPGRLLDAMLGAVDRSRQENVFVTTAVKCRPPGDRDPLPAELEACRPYLDRQMALFGPQLLLAIGESAAQALLGEAVDPGDRRGRALTVASDERNVRVVVTHAPARLLAEPHLKAEAWADLCVARAA